MSNTKEVHSKSRLHVSLSTCYLEYGSHLARLHRRRRRRRRAYAPTSNTTSHDNHEKINSWVSFCFPYMGCLWGSAWRPFGPPELRYKSPPCPPPPLPTGILYSPQFRHQETKMAALSDSTIVINDLTEIGDCGQSNKQVHSLMSRTAITLKLKCPCF